MNIQEPLCPYNIKNTLITPDNVRSIVSKYGTNLQVNNIALFRQALTHKSYIGYNDTSHKKKCKVDGCQFIMSKVKLQEQSYERLEYLGDSVIKLIISQYLFKRYPCKNEGFMTKLKTKIENKTSLAHLSQMIGLGPYMVISSQIEDSVGRMSEKILEDVFEAFFGALFLDSSFDVCNQLMITIMEQEVDFSGILYIDTNYKDQLLRFYHKNKWNPPQYKALGTTGSSKKNFVMGVMDKNGKVIAKGTDSSKRKAEQEASRVALLKFNQLQHEISLDDTNVFELQNVEQVFKDPVTSR